MTIPMRRKAGIPTRTAFSNCRNHFIEAKYPRRPYALRELVRRPVAGKHDAGNVPGFAGSASYGEETKRSRNAAEPQSESSRGGGRSSGTASPGIELSPKLLALAD